MLVLDALFDHIQQISSNVESSKSVLLRTLVAASVAKNGGFWCVQFCTEMARPKRFELLTPRFVVWCSIQLSYGRVLRIAREVFPENPESQGTASSYRLRPMLASFGVHVPLSPAGFTRGPIPLP